MNKTVLKQSLNSLNLLLVAAFLLMALYSAIGQQIFPYIGQYREYAEDYLSERLDSNVEIRSLSGDMQILIPSIQVEGVKIAGKQAHQANLSIASIDAVLNPRLSLLNLSPVFDRVRISGLYLSFGDKQESEQENNPEAIQKLITRLLLQQHLELNNVTVDFGDDNILQLDHIVMTGDGFHRLMTGSVVYGEEKQIRANMEVYSEGNPFNLEQFYARGNMDIPSVDVAHWLKKITGETPVSQFMPSAKVGFEFKEGLLHYAKFNLSSPYLELSQQNMFSDLDTQLWVQQQSLDSWSVWLDHAKFGLKGEQWSLQHLGVNLSQREGVNRWQYFAEELDLDYSQNLLYDLSLVPDKADELLDALSPSGVLKNANLIVHQDSNGKNDYSFVAEMDALSVLPYKGAPGVNNLSGVVALNEKGGRVQFDSQDMILNFPGIYAQPFESKQAQGQVDWLISDKKIMVSAQDLYLDIQEVDSIMGGFQLWLPNQPELDGQLLLNLGLNNASVSAHKRLVPNVAGDDLRNWLAQALGEGEINSAQFLLMSQLSDSNAETQLELRLDVADGEIQYLNDWPKVNDVAGTVWVQNQQVWGSFNNASTLGGKVDSLNLAYNPDGLYIDGAIAGEAEDILTYFTQTPLADVVDNQMQGWQLQGQQNTKLGLYVPRDDSDLRVQVTSNLQNTHLNILDLEFEKTQGTIRYHSSKGLFSDSLTTQLWMHDYSVEIQSQLTTDGFSPRIGFNGVLDSKALKDWLGLSLLHPISGNTEINGDIYINRVLDGFSGIEVSSQLTGIDVAIPQPYGKAADVPRDFHFSMSFNETPELGLRYNETLNMAMTLNQGKVGSGQVYLGSTEAYIPANPGLLIEGHIPSIHVEDWLELWQKIQNKDQATLSSVSNNPDSTSASQTQDASIISELRLSSDRVQYQDQVVKDVKLDAQQKNGTWSLAVDSPLVKGNGQYATNGAVDVELDYIHWPHSDMDNTEQEQVDVFANIDPTTLPDVRFSVGEVFVGSTNYGQWSVDMSTDADHIYLNNIKGLIKKLSVQGQAQWQSTMLGAEQNTRLNLKLETDDVAGVQAAWRSKPVVRADSTQADIMASWQGSPLQYNSQSLNGYVSFKMRDGLFVDAGEAGALNVFGILNFGAIGRRLRLDFSDLYSSGVHFDAVDGKASIEQGVLTIIDTLDINGPSADFSASGRVNLNTKELDQQLSVTVPITSSLPFVAILAGFAPPVAASLFFGEKIVGDEIEKFTSATYDVKGTWNEPELTLRKRFDNEIEGKQSKGFWDRMRRFFGLGDD
ncbi:YhdP family protein [Bermanella sp. R86510]|uniref:YhdP family protein n=1 Tax=unclassified Bermanella TaxID=2627862 RepID=UPI0037CA2380